MEEKYNRAIFKENGREEISRRDYDNYYDKGIDNYYLDFDIYDRNNELKISDFIENFLEKIPECKSCQRYKIALGTYYNSCFLYNGGILDKKEPCKITGLEFFIEEDYENDERIILIKKEDEILARLKIKLDPVLEGGPLI